MICSYLGFLNLTWQQQAASLRVKHSSFAVDWFVGFPVKFDGRLFPSSHSDRIHSHSYIYALTKTQL